MKTKDERQDEFVETWRKAHGIGTFEAPPGFGKTTTGIKIIQRLRELNPVKRVGVIVPQDVLVDQWQRNLLSWRQSPFTKVLIINSAIKQEHEFDLLILDEIHRYGSEQFSKIFDCVKYRFILGLTATMKRLDNKHRLIEKYCPVIDRITISEARKAGYIAQYQEFNLGIDMPVSEQKGYDELEEKYNACLSLFGYDFKLMQKCSQSYKPLVLSSNPRLGITYSDSHCSRLAREYGWNGISAYNAHLKLRAKQKPIWGPAGHKYHPDRIFINAINGMRYIRSIKKIVYSHPLKLDMAEQLLIAIPTRAITFAETTAVADRMTGRFKSESVSYHSSVPAIAGVKGGKKRSREIALELFDSGSARIINTAKALDQGADFPDVVMGIRIAGTSSQTSQTQRRGRIVRLHGNKKSVMINLYLKNTKEVKWLTISQKRSEVIWVDTIDEILEQIEI